MYCVIIVLNILLHIYCLPCIRHSYRQIVLINSFSFIVIMSVLKERFDDMFDIPMSQLFFFFFC